MDTAGQLPSDCKRQLVDGRALVVSPASQSSCQDGLLELNVPTVPESRSVQEGCLTE